MPATKIDAAVRRNTRVGMSVTTLPVRKRRLIIARLRHMEMTRKGPPCFLASAQARYKNLPGTGSTGWSDGGGDSADSNGTPDPVAAAHQAAIESSAEHVGESLQTYDIHAGDGLMLELQLRPTRNAAPPTAPKANLCKRTFASP
jgi:hypothetical protein